MEGEQGSLNGRREVIRGELRRNVMGQLKDQIYLEDEQLYEQIDTAIRQKGKETYLPAFKGNGCGCETVCMTVSVGWISSRNF